MDASGQNLEFAARQLWRNPGFSATVILTLALSIGANTAIFSIVNALILKSLPYSHPERMGTIYTRVTGPMASDERHHVNGEQWELLRDEVPSLMSAVSGIRASGVNLQAGSQSGQREAPSASRVATSGVRRSTRTSVSPARFAQAISRMTPSSWLRRAAWTALASA